jgi:hypothetical protein
MRKMHQAFTKISYYHVKRENNKDVDQLANISISKKEGCLTHDNTNIQQPIP